MSEHSDSNEFLSYEEALMSQVLTLDALVNVLERKGMVNREEILEELKELYAKAAEPD
jgi:hypothetical protein